MKFLIEKSIISQEQELSLSNKSPNQKRKIAQQILKKLPNYKNLKSAETIYIDSLIEDGFDDIKNPFITFMNKVPESIAIDTAKLVQTLISNKKLDADASWLYNKTLYTPHEDIDYKIKALTYADNESLQHGASKQLNVSDFIKQGKIRPRSEIQNILNRINISKTSKIGDLYNISQINKLGLDPEEKDDFVDYIKINKNEYTKANSISDLYKDWSETSKQGKAKTREKQAAEKEQQKIADKGYTLLKSILDTDTLTPQLVRNYVLNLMPDSNTRAIIQQYLASGDLDDSIEDVLSKDITSSMGRDRKEILDKRLYDTVSAEYNKLFKGTK